MELTITLYNNDGSIAEQHTGPAQTATDDQINKIIGLIGHGMPAHQAAALVTHDPAGDLYRQKHDGKPLDGTCVARSKPAPKDKTLLEELNIKPWDTTKNFIRAVDLYLAGHITWTDASQMISRKEKI